MTFVDVKIYIHVSCYVTLLCDVTRKPRLRCKRMDYKRLKTVNKTNAVLRINVHFFKNYKYVDFTFLLVKLSALSSGDSIRVRLGLKYLVWSAKTWQGIFSTSP